MQIFGHFEGFPLKSVMVWVGSTMTPVERAELLWPKHKFKIRWSEKIRKHGWILWCIYVWLHDLRWFKFSNALLIYVVHYSEPWYMEYIGMYWSISNYDVEICSFKNETIKPRHKTNQNHPLFSSTRCDGSSFHEFPGRMAAEVELVPEALHSFFVGMRHGRFSLVLCQFFFLKHFFCNKNNSQQSYFDTSPGVMNASWAEGNCWWLNHGGWGPNDWGGGLPWKGWKMVGGWVRETWLGDLYLPKIAKGSR